MPRVQPPKYKKPTPSWVPQVIFALFLAGLFSFGVLMADISGMQRGLETCNQMLSEAQEGPLQPFVDDLRVNTPEACNYLFESQNSEITDEQIQACEKEYNKL